MVRKFFILAGLLNLVLLVNAQTAEKNIAVSLNMVKNEYDGDYGNAILNLNKPWYVAGGISLSAYLTHSFDIGIQGSYGSYGYYDTEINRFSGSKFDLSAFTHYKFNNGYLLKKESRLAPFISLGIGLATYGTINDAAPYPTIVTKGVDLIIPLGIGFKYQLTNSVSIQYQYLYNITNADNHDENRGARIFGSGDHPYFKSGNDAFGQSIIGLVFSFRGPKIVNLRKINSCMCELN